MRSGAIFLGLALSLSLSSSAEAQTKGKAPSKTDQGNYVGRVQAKLRKSRNARTLDSSQFSSYSKFKSALSSTVKRVYKPLVVEVDNGLVDGILKPLHNGLLYNRFRQDKKLLKQAKISGAKLIVSFSKNGEITFADTVKYKPFTVKSCSDTSRSTQIPCAKTSKQLARASEAFARKPDQDLLKKVDRFKASYAKHQKSNKGTYAGVLKGQPISKMKPLQLASTVFAASPGTSTRAGTYFPPAFFAYKKVPKAATGGASTGQQAPNLDVDVRPDGGTVVPRGRLKGQDVDHLWHYATDSVDHSRGLIASKSPSALFDESQSKIESWLNNSPSTKMPSEALNLAYAVTNNGRNTNYQLVNGFTVDKSTEMGRSYRTHVNWCWFGCRVNYRYGWTLNYSYLYGIRAAFDVNTTATFTNRRARNGNMRIQMSTGNKNADIFRGAFRRNNQRLVYNGRELLAELCHRGCGISLWGDVPGPDPLPIRRNMDRYNLLEELPPAAGQIRTGHFNWPNVGGRTNIGTLVAPLDLFGGQLRKCIRSYCAGATAYPYVTLDMRGLRYPQKWAKNNGQNQFADVRSINSQNSTLQFNFSAIPNIRAPLATGLNNKYTFDFELTPGIRFSADLIVTDYSYDLDIPGLAIDSPDFPLNQHSGSWNGAWTSVPN